MPPQISGYQPFFQQEQAKSEKIRSLFSYWLRLRRDGIPGPRTSFDPVEVPRLLSSLLLGDIESDPFRVFFRLVGTRVAEFSRLDFSGYYLDALDYRDRDSIEWSGCYRQLHDSGTGLIGINRVAWPDDESKEYPFAILPLERNGDPAGSFVAIEDYGDLDLNTFTEMPGVTIFERAKK